jgi:2-phosphosulfolactate phosphatase
MARKLMRVDLHFNPMLVDEMQLRDKNIVVVDVLRASTSIAAALANGAKEVIPVETVEAAVKISSSLSGDVVLLGGERGGKIIEGFHLGNSPSEYAAEVVKGKSIVYTTTNGTLAISKGRHAKRMVVAGFVNAGQAAAFIKRVGEDFTLLCAGNQLSPGGFSLEDAVCAGMIIGLLQKNGVRSLDLSDSVLGALTLYRSFGKKILKMMENSEQGKYHIELGMKDDLKICAAVNSIPVLPIFRGNVLKLDREPAGKA